MEDAPEDGPKRERKERLEPATRSNYYGDRSLNRLGPPGRSAGVESAGGDAEPAGSLAGWPAGGAHEPSNLNLAKLGH